MGVNKRLGALAIAVVLAACSDGERGESGTIGGPGTDGWTPDTFLPSASFKNQCAAPRTGVDSNGQPFPDIQGTTLAENNWLRSWTNELYLWYREVGDFNPTNYSSANYFRLLKTFETTPSGAAKDKFHFTTPTAEWQSFSQSGTSLGYGATFEFVSGAPPREVIVVLVEPNSPAAEAGLLRGDRVVSVDSIDINSNNTSALNAGLLPDQVDERHTFGIRTGSDPARTVTLTAQRVNSTPVHTVDIIPSDTGPVGYILFNDHIASAEDGLVDAFQTLSNEQEPITDLVLDLRYNGGGYIDIASQVAYMIAGTATGGKDFERTVWNDKHPTTNPVTGQPLAPMPFIDTTIGLSRPEGTPLPTLDLRRVYVITSEATCSASEAIMNGLRGIDIEVIQIGTATCGKPYGFYDFDNCGTTYFSVQFQGVNAKGFGDYTDGFTPANTPDDELGTRLPGCMAADDYNHQLGDPSENMLSVALAYQANGECPAESATLGAGKTSRTARTAGVIARPPYREIRRMRAEDLAH